MLFRSKTYQVIDPATEQPCTEITLGTAADVDKAVAAARRAFESWSQTSVDERKAFAHKLAASYPSLPESLLSRFCRDELIATEVSKPAFDLEFDTALNDAIKLLDAPDFQARLAASKTVKELVEAKKAAAAAATPAAATPAAASGSGSTAPSATDSGAKN